MDSKTETVSDNELIARFMGFEVYNDELFGKTIRVFSIKTNDSVLRALKRQHISQLQYNISWDWLMPVVEKIESIDGIRFIIEKNRVMVMNSQNEYFWNSGTTSETKITTTYNAVVEFIKHFNSQSPNTIK